MNCPLLLLQEGATDQGSEAKPASEEERRGAVLGEAMLDGSLMGVDSLSVAESAAGCILSHPDAPTRKVSQPAPQASKAFWEFQSDNSWDGLLLPDAAHCWHDVAAFIVIECMCALLTAGSLTSWTVFSQAPGLLRPKC